MYKTIVVHADRTEQAAQRIDLAARLALKYDAHLVGAAMTGITSYMYPIGSFDIAPPPMPFPVDDLRAEAERALDAFEARARSAGVLSYERRQVDDEAGIALALQSRYCDLVVVGQAGHDASSPRLRAGHADYLLLNAVSPVLVVPAGGVAGEIGRRITVAWNASPNAARAVRSALPWLRSAEQVDLVVYNADADGEAHGEQAGADLALYLARHAIKVEVWAGESPANAGDALLAHAAARGSDLIVMGAYGHARFREVVFGGATRRAISSSRLPLWMAH